MKQHVQAGSIAQKEHVVREAASQLETLYQKQRALTELMQPSANALAALRQDSFLPTTEKTPTMAAMQAALDEQKAAWRLLRQECQRLECAMVFQKNDLRSALARAVYLREAIAQRQGLVKKTNAPLFAAETYMSPETKSSINRESSSELAKLQRELAALEGEDETLPDEAA